MMLQYFTDPEELLSLAASLVFLGLVLWRLPYVYRDLLKKRAEYAVEISDQGHAARAQKIRDETQVIRRRIPKYSIALIVVGVVIGVIGIFRL